MFECVPSIIGKIVLTYWYVAGTTINRVFFGKKIHAERMC